MTRSNETRDRRPDRLAMTLEEEVVVRIQRSATQAARWVAEALKPFGLTPPQYNVLRILRGARPEALCARVIADRMITYDPDLTRLIDRLEAAGWVHKSRDEADRRKVNLSVTPEGLDLVDRSTEVIHQRLAEALGATSPSQLRGLIASLHHLKISEPGVPSPAAEVHQAEPAPKPHVSRKLNQPMKGN